MTILISAIAEQSHAAWSNLAAIIDILLNTLTLLLDTLTLPFNLALLLDTFRNGAYFALQSWFIEYLSLENFEVGSSQIKNDKPISYFVIISKARDKLRRWPAIGSRINGKTITRATTAQVNYPIVQEWHFARKDIYKIEIRSTVSFYWKNIFINHVPACLFTLCVI